MSDNLNLRVKTTKLIRRHSGSYRADIQLLKAGYVHSDFRDVWIIDGELILDEED